MGTLSSAQGIASLLTSRLCSHAAASPSGRAIQQCLSPIWSSCGHWRRALSSSASVQAANVNDGGGPVETDEYSTASTPRPDSKAAPHGFPTECIAAACVLERLPILMPSAPDWEVEHDAWLRQRELRLGIVKQYPQTKKEMGSVTESSASDLQDLRKFTPMPRSTEADSSGNRRTMRRRLEERLYLLVRCTGDNRHWTFPTTPHRGGEPIDKTARHALYRVISKQHPIFFIGHGPMAHRNVEQVQPTDSHTIFYHLAQVVEDPWDVKIQPDCGYDDFAWVTKSEMPEYLQDARLEELVQKML